MSKQLTSKQIKSMGGEVLPFERYNAKTKSFKEVLDGEDICLKYQKISDCLLPENYINFDGQQSSLIEKKRFLWVIDKYGLKIILENTPVQSKRKHACHTNITGGNKAIQGGEMWIGSQSELYINFFSGRYNHTTEQEYFYALEYIKSLGFNVIDVSKF